jgi:hypothetical protein
MFAKRFFLKFRENYSIFAFFSKIYTHKNIFFSTDLLPFEIRTLKIFNVCCTGTVHNILVL